LPGSWRRERVNALPDPLIGAGLGLFGLRELPFVDRDAARDQIWETLRDVVDNGGVQVVVLAGGPGTGKSSLAKWVACRADEVGAVQQLFAVHTPGAPSKAEGLTGLMHRAFHSWKLERDELHEFLRDDLAQSSREHQFADDDARALTEWLAPQRHDDAPANGPRFRFSNARQRHALALRLMARLSCSRPVYAWLDDLQWGPATLDILEYIVHADSPVPDALVVATVRADVLAEQPDLAERIDALVALPNCRRIDLESLASEDHRELVRRMLSLEDELVELLAGQTEGNPLFATQLLRHLIDRGHIEIGEDGFRLVDGVDTLLPDDIFELWVGRIDRLVATFPDNDRRDARWAVELAAALGKQVDVDELRRACERRQIKFPSALVDRVVALGLGGETANGWEFAHGLLVDSLGEQARQAGRWRQHHRCCALALQTETSASGLATAERRAEHWIAAGDDHKALAPLLDAVKFERRRGRLEPTRALVVRRSEVLDRLGVQQDDPRRLENDASLAGFCQALEPGSGRAEQLAERVRGDAERVGAHGALARVLDVLVRIADGRGHIDRALSLAEQAVQAARRCGDPSRLALAYSRLAWTHFSQPDLDAAATFFREGIRCGEEAENIYRVLYDRAGLVNVAVQRGQFDAAMESAKDLIDAVRLEGFCTIEDNLVNALGAAAKYVGDYETALQSYRASERLAHTLDDQRRLAYALLQQAGVHAAAAHVDDTERLLGEVDERFSKPGFEAVSATVELTRLVHAANRGDLARFDRLAAPFDGGWPEGQFLFRDAAWLAELAARRVDHAGHTERATSVRAMACEMYVKLGDHDTAKRMGTKRMGTK
jgi:tetratricopeptide (TPR) repeat protein